MSNSSNFQQRLITGILGAAVFVGSVIFHEYSFLVILFLGINLCITEFYTLVQSAAKVQKVMGYTISNIILALSYGITKGFFPSTYLMLLIPLTCIVFFAELYRKLDNPFTNIAFTLLGILYIAVPFSLVNAVSFVEGTYHWQIIIGYFLILWTSDSMAYFCGRLFGKTKLFERISPKKTWEGSIGALLFSIGMAYLLSIYFTMLPVSSWIVIAIITVISGGMADLVESLLKRSFDIKDSGTLLPGHGGFLDRFDGMLLSIPLIATYLVIIG